MSEYRSYRFPFHQYVDTNVVCESCTRKLSKKGEHEHVVFMKVCDGIFWHCPVCHHTISVLTDIKTGRNSIHCSDCRICEELAGHRKQEETK